jgi:hypothetical protein
LVWSDASENLVHDGHSSNLHLKIEVNADRTIWFKFYSVWHKAIERPPIVLPMEYTMIHEYQPYPIREKIMGGRGKIKWELLEHPEMFRLLRYQWDSDYLAL